MSEDLGAEPWRLGVGQVLHPLIDPAMSTAATIGMCDPNFFQNITPFARGQQGLSGPFPNGSYGSFAVWS